MTVRPSHSDYYYRAPRKVLPPPVVSVTTSPQGRRRRRRAPCRWLGPLLRRRAPRRLGREGRAAAVRGSECLGGGGAHHHRRHRHRHGGQGERGDASPVAVGASCCSGPRPRPARRPRRPARCLVALGGRLSGLPGGQAEAGGARMLAEQPLERLSARPSPMWALLGVGARGQRLLAGPRGRRAARKEAEAAAAGGGGPPRGGGKGRERGAARLPSSAV